LAAAARTPGQTPGWSGLEGSSARSPGGLLAAPQPQVPSQSALERTSHAELPGRRAGWCYLAREGGSKRSAMRVALHHRWDLPDALVRSPGRTTTALDGPPPLSHLRAVLSTSLVRPLRVRSRRTVGPRGDRSLHRPDLVRQQPLIYPRSARPCRVARLSAGGSFDSLLTTWSLLGPTVPVSRARDPGRLSGRMGSALGGRRPAHVRHGGLTTRTPLRGDRTIEETVLSTAGQ